MIAAQIICLHDPTMFVTKQCFTSDTSGTQSVHLGRELESILPGQESELILARHSLLGWLCTMLLLSGLLHCIVLSPDDSSPQLGPALHLCGVNEQGQAS